jgi:thiamine pyrophosphokinase
MLKDYLEAADRVSELANEFMDDYDLATVLRAGSSKIMQKAQENNLLIMKIAEEIPATANE